jgi:hypothetical protein
VLQEAQLPFFSFKLVREFCRLQQPAFNQLSSTQMVQDPSTEIDLSLVYSTFLYIFDAVLLLIVVYQIRTKSKILKSKASRYDISILLLFIISLSFHAVFIDCWYKSEAGYYPNYNTICQGTIFIRTVSFLLLSILPGFVFNCFFFVSSKHDLYPYTPVCRAERIKERCKVDDFISCSSTSVDC